MDTLAEIIKRHKAAVALLFAVGLGAGGVSLCGEYLSLPEAVAETRTKVARQDTVLMRFGEELHDIKVLSCIMVRESTGETATECVSLADRVKP